MSKLWHVYNVTTKLEVKKLIGVVDNKNQTRTKVKDETLVP